jgi:tetratricopeptide (TPR) repeat protein
LRTIQSCVEEAFAAHRNGDLRKAETIYDQLLCQLDKPDANVLFGMGTLLVSQQKYGLGIKLLEETLTLAPKFAPLWTNLACAYKQTSRDDDALECYNKALALDPNAPDVLAGMAGFWINKAEPQRVVQYARQALAFDPDHHAAHMHLALGLLEQGKFDEAWPHYEHRWETPERVKDKRPYNAPRWTGQRVHTLAIHGEQGLGDEILFMSLFRKAREHADNIIIECAERLVPIFAETFQVPCYPDHKSLIAAHGEPDAYIPMASLPGVLGLPDGRPFLKRSRLRSNGRPLIGIAWSGGTLRTAHKERSLLLKDFAPILETSGVDFCSVQYGQELDPQLAEMGLPTGEPTDLLSLHQRIADCDLVISVCQTAVHQAGALGVPTWCLVPHRAAWRYALPDMQPWYSSVRFFRQRPTMEWSPVIAQIADQLKRTYVASAA